MSCQVDHEHRLVEAIAQGFLTDAEIFKYQRETWSRPEIAGYNELIDMSRVTVAELVSASRMKELVNLSASMAALLPPSKQAIVAPDDTYFGLGRMYKNYHDLGTSDAKEVGVFRSRVEALNWLASGTAASPDPTSQIVR